MSTRCKCLNKIYAGLALAPFEWLRDAYTTLGKKISQACMHASNSNPLANLLPQNSELVIECGQRLLVPDKIRHNCMKFQEVCVMLHGFLIHLIL